jgi:asparagine synthase (glutamine-hydrolysing)
VCGIAGYIGDRELDRSRIECCLRLMRRRGPDAAGHGRYRTPAGLAVDLLNTRLAILDLDERANQPFVYGSKRLTYNGELYNYLELRDELERLGAHFTTDSDTEVVVAAIDRLGWDALDGFEGMWGLALYDEEDGSLVLARDRFGEKPLYLHRDDSGLYFGSEAKFVFALLGRRLAVDGRQLRRYLVNGYRSLYKGDATFFADLEELSPGTLLRLDAHGGGMPRRYWKPDLDVEEDMSYEDAVDGVRERLVRSVELRLRADVPLAFCMSGGVDSNALIAVARRECGYDVHGFTIVTDDARYDERQAVDRAVAELGVRHTQVPLGTDGFLDRLRELVRYHDAPVYTISYYAHWRLMEQIAAAGYRVAVSGTAADELFTGYYDHHLAYLAEVAAEPVVHGAATASWTEHVRPLVRNPLLRDPALFVDAPAFRDHLYLDADDFASALVEPWSEPFVEEHYVDGVLRNRMLNELFQEVVPVILHEDDLNAMYYSVENRSPYLDRGLFEFSLRIPTRELVRNGFAKAVLRDAVRGIAPDGIVGERRKVGFNAPILELLDLSDAAVRRELLADSPIYDVVRRERVQELLDSDRLPNSRSKFLFSFLCAKLFLEEFAA